MEKLKSLLQNLWNENKLPNVSLIVCGDHNLAKDEIFSFIGTVTSRFSKISPENNTDIIIVEAKIDKNGEKSSIINIEQARELHSHFETKAIFSPYKFGVISSAEDMNINASNSLLKIFEDSSFNNYFFLITSNEEYLIPTIRSRSVVIYKENNQIQKNLSGDLIYKLWNPEVRFDDKDQILNIILKSKDISEEDIANEIIHYLSQLLSSNSSAATNEQESLRQIIFSKNDGLKLFSDYLEYSKNLLQNMVKFHLDLKQVILLLISKFGIIFK